MTSLFAQLFIALQLQIKKAVPEIKWIDQDLGQLEYYETRPAVSWPAVLIDFPATQYREHSQMVQWAELQINIRLAFSPFSSANSAAPDLSKEKALQFYETENRLFAALNGFTAGGCIQPMVRVSVHSEQRDDPFRVRTMLFTTATEDDTVMEVARVTAAELNLENSLYQQ